MKQLFPAIPLVRFEPDSRECGGGRNRQVLKTHTRTIATLAIGQMRAHETLMICEHCKTIARSEQLRRLVPQYGKFGFDVIVHVGTELFVKSRSEHEIKQQLADKNIPISIREIGYLGARFITYLALLHKDARRNVKDLLSSHGGYILHLDGTCEGDSPHLMTAIDELSEIVLGNVKLPSENAAMIVPFLKELKRNFGQPLAMVHDMGAGILDAVSQVFPGVVDFICHFHFLRDIGKDLFDHEHTGLRNGFKKRRIRTHLRNIAKKLRQQIHYDRVWNHALESIPGDTQAWQNNDAQQLPPIVRAYMLVLWVLDSDADLDGIGFPFDRAQLAFYERIRTAWDVIERNPKDMLDHIAPLRRALLLVMNDKDMKTTAEQLRGKVALFDQLRTAMRIALPDSDRGLNDDGTDSDIITIKAKVSTFRERLAARIAAMPQPELAYIKMLKQIDKYWGKLFADPIEVKTVNGKIMIQPQRTNNMLERFFRDLKRRNRKKSGSLSMTKTLRTMLADTPLVKNLQNEQYMKAILNGSPDLQTRFAQIESAVVREKLREDARNPERIPTSLKKILRLPGLLTKIVPISMMRGAANLKSNQPLPS